MTIPATDIAHSPDGTAYLAATVSCADGCSKQVVVYLKCSGGGFRVVGIDR